MADGGVQISKDLALRMKAVVEDYERRVGPISPRGKELDSLPQTPETNLVRTPTGGIPASETETGIVDGFRSVSCHVYKRVPGIKPIRVGQLSRIVFNPFTSDIPGNRWLTVTKDKHGTWWATASEASDEIDPAATPNTPGSIGCNLARLKPTDCIIVEGPINSVIMHPGGGSWGSVEADTGSEGEYIYYLDKYGALTGQFNTSTGLFDLFLDGVRLQNCQNRCYTGGPLTGHYRSGTDTTGECEGEVFTFCIRCICCDAPTLWTGAGWYCVEMDDPEETGTETVCSPLYLATLEDACGETICSIRYNSYEEAAANCTYSMTCAASPPECPAGTATRVSGIAYLRYTLDGTTLVTKRLIITSAIGGILEFHNEGRICNGMTGGASPHTDVGWTFNLGCDAGIGITRYVLGACSASFGTPTGGTPIGCYQPGCAFASLAPGFNNAGIPICSGFQHYTITVPDNAALGMTGITISDR